MSQSPRRPPRPTAPEPAEPVRPPGGGERAPAARGSFGQWLKGQREARGVDLAEIAEASKISVRYLEALESDRFDILPARVFVRGFLREYARIAGLDADEVVNLFLVSAPRATPERRLESPAPSYGSFSSGPALGRGLIVAAGVVLVLALAGGVAYWAATRATRAVKSASATETPAPAPKPRAPAPQAAPPVSASPVAAEAVSGPAATPTAPAGTSPPAAAETASTPRPAPPAPAEPSPIVLVLAFQQDCWVETRVDGGRRASELKAGGETLTLSAQEFVLLTLGNAPAVRAELNGRPLALPTDASRLLRDFRVDKTFLSETIPPSLPPPSPPSQP